MDILLKQKSDACVSIQHFFKYVKTQYDRIVKVIITDNGSEFVTSVCEQMFKELGTIHQRTCVYTPQQNGVAENKHRHILEVTRAIRFQAHIPIKVWGYCVLVVVYLINRMPSVVIGNISLFERLHKRKPSLMHLRIIRCLCFAKTVQEHDKLMPRAKLAIHMGYSEVQKWYILYDPTNKSFFTSRDVIFREDVYPFTKKDNSHSQVFVDITPELRMMYDHPILSQNRNTNTTTNVGDNSEPSGTNIQQNTESDNTDMLTDYSENDMQHNIEENCIDVVQAQTDEGLGSDATQTNTLQTPCIY